jgi:hypothetical protein
MVHGNGPRSFKANSAHSVYAGTIVGSTSRISHPLDSSTTLEGRGSHEIYCSGCNKVGIYVHSGFPDSFFFLAYIWH